MRPNEFSPAARALAFCIGLLAFASASHAAGDKAAYDSAKASAKATYEAAARQCDAATGNAKDICVAEAKAVRTRTEVDAEVTYKDTPKARQHAIEETAEASYKVARERCDDRTGNDKDVCIKVAKAELTRLKADAKANRKITDARVDASKDKREADYKVAAEKCEAMTGDARSACVAQAKAKYGM
jgi:hypothetical protein